MAFWFTADTHFSHWNIVKYCTRPFSSIEEHDETLISNWNYCIKGNDTVYHLGDFAFRNPISLEKITKRLNGKIILLRGNHDKRIKGDLTSLFSEVKDVHLFTGQLHKEKVTLYLSHYAHRSWPSSFHGVGHLYGHSHGRLPPHGLSFDVGVDCWNFYPVSLEQVVSKLQSMKKSGITNQD